MTFFTTPELLEIGDMPFSSPNQKPTRTEALEYYRKVAEHYALDVRQYRDGRPGDGLRRRLHRPHHRPLRPRLAASRAASSPSPPATTTCPTTSTFPAKSLTKVKHYYHEPHPYFGLDVVVIGGKNSAAIAALDLWRHGARITLVHRGAGDASPCEVLDPARHRQPHQERRGHGPLQLTVDKHHRGRRHHRDARRRGDHPQSLRLRADRLPPRLRLPGAPRHQA